MRIGRRADLEFNSLTNLWQLRTHKQNYRTRCRNYVISSSKSCFCLFPSGVFQRMTWCIPVIGRSSMWELRERPWCIPRIWQKCHWKWTGRVIVYAFLDDNDTPFQQRGSGGYNSILLYLISYYIAKITKNLDVSTSFRLGLRQKIAGTQFFWILTHHYKQSYSLPMTSLWHVSLCIHFLPCCHSRASSSSGSD